MHAWWYGCPEIHSGLQGVSKILGQIEERVLRVKTKKQMLINMCPEMSDLWV